MSRTGFSADDHRDAVILLARIIPEDFPRGVWMGWRAGISDGGAAPDGPPACVASNTAARLMQAVGRSRATWLHERLGTGLSARPQLRPRRGRGPQVPFAQPTGRLARKPDRGFRRPIPSRHRAALPCSMPPKRLHDGI